jgi:hypothetical protein
LPTGGVAATAAAIDPARLGLRLMVIVPFALWLIHAV